MPLAIVRNLWYTLIMNCELCNDPITGSGKRYCSLSCSSKAKNNGRARNPDTYYERTCVRDECSNVFSARGEPKKKFCSKSCSAIVANAGRNRHAGRTRTDARCIQCGNTMSYRLKDYCSTACRRQEKIDKWFNGEISGNGAYSICGWAREIILERAGYRCEGYDERIPGRCIENRFKPGGTTVLHVDHIDGDWQNSVYYNLRALCPTCHTLTHNFGAGNMGKGRTLKKNYNQFEPKSPGPKH